MRACVITTAEITGFRTSDSQGIHKPGGRAAAVTADLSHTTKDTSNQPRFRAQLLLPAFMCRLLSAKRVTRLGRIHELQVDSNVKADRVGANAPAPTRKTLLQQETSAPLGQQLRTSSSESNLFFVFFPLVL